MSDKYPIVYDEHIFIDEFGNGFSMAPAIINSLTSKEQIEVNLCQQKNPKNLSNRFGYAKIETNYEVTLDLIIPNVDKRNKGRYACVAINGVGKDENAMSVEVLCNLTKNKNYN